jgi:hypothetical protein
MVEVKTGISDYGQYRNFIRYSADGTEIITAIHGSPND